MIAPMSMMSPVSSVAVARTDVLLVDSDAETSRYSAYMNEHYRITATSRAATAADFIRRSGPALVVTDLTLEDGSGVGVCRAGKALPVPATVLVTTTQPEAVPDALRAGCDGVLLKPFAPNLLVGRVGRLLRERSAQLRLAAARSMSKSGHLTERIQLMKSGTNRVWPNTHCPYCENSGVTSFDFASMRRAWYACLECGKVWMAKRQE
jgi:DNA-binding response OmpR family regulator